MDQTTASDRRTALVASLHALANWYEQHPEVALPPFPRWTHCVRRGDEQTGIAEVEIIATALGVAADYDDHDVSADARFGPIGFHAYNLRNAAMAEYAARQEIADAAAWILVCDAGHLPTSTTYATEQAANAVLDMHATACAGGHTVHLVSPAPTGELVQA